MTVLVKQSIAWKVLVMGGELAKLIIRKSN